MEEGKTLNLGGLKAPVADENAPDTKTDNFDQTQFNRPNTNETNQQAQNEAPADPIADEITAQRVVNAGVTGAEEGETVYSSHPIKRLLIGRFSFEDGVLRLKGDDLAEFEKLLDSLPRGDRASVKKLDMDRVDAIVQQRRAVQGAFDSGVGREALEKLHAESPTLGREDISHAALPQTDNNQPVPPTIPVDPEGKTGLDQGPHIAPEQTPPA